MLKNHIKIAWRNLKANRLFSGINILGLSLGLAITIVLYLFISHERSFDKMYSQQDQIYRILVDAEFDGQTEIFTHAPAALAPAIKSDIPEVKEVARLLKHDFGGNAYINIEDRNYIEKSLYWTDASVVEIFEINFLKGDAKSALTRPNTVALSQSTAEKYFPGEEAIGKSIKVDNHYDLEVTGVFEDFPANSTMDATVLASFSTTNFYKRPSWGNSSFLTYCLLNKEADPNEFKAQLQVVLDKNVAKEDQWFTLDIQSLSDIHLYSASYEDSYNSRKGNIAEIKNLSILAVIILLIACINYMNLITARSQKRSKDVGVNKTLGATSNNLLVRFYVETGVITCIALLIGIGLSLIAVPTFNSITGQNIDVSLMLSVEFIFGLVAIWLITTLISGSYPAMYMSRFSPKSILNPSFKRSTNIILVRKSLVVLQFTASVVLIIAVMVIYNQLSYMRSKELGFNPESVMAISTDAVASNENVEALVQEYNNMSLVNASALAQGFPSMSVSGRSLVKDDNDEHGMSIRTNRSDPSIAKVLELKLLAGKMPAKRKPGDTLVEVTLNKKAVDYLELTPKEVIGKKVSMQLGANAYVVGVVDNFNYASLHEPIGGYAFHNRATEPKSYLLLRFNNAGLASALSQFESTFKKVVPNASFDYVFLDKNVEKLYAQEQKTASISMIFCGLAIFVGCLGLFALAAFSTEQRSKEIGIRKVVGASTAAITKLLSKDFLVLIVLALIIAIPIGYWLMKQWLEGFAYRIELTWLTFFVASIIALTIAMLTISIQSIKAAVKNPVDALRSE